MSREQGSPPRVRGKRLINKLFYLRIGITPARAGKTFVHNFLKNF